MADFKTELKERMFQFAVDCGKLCNQVLEQRKYYTYCNQLIRSSASVGANYRAACRTKSDKDFINKLKIVEEEADESMYWIKILMAFTDEESENLKRLHTEANELLSITIASITTMRKRIDSK